MPAHSRSSPAVSISQARGNTRTIERRPDLIEARGGLTDGDRALLAKFGLG